MVVCGVWSYESHLWMKILAEYISKMCTFSWTNGIHLVKISDLWQVCLVRRVKHNLEHQYNQTWKQKTVRECACIKLIVPKLHWNPVCLSMISNPIDNCGIVLQKELVGFSMNYVVWIPMILSLFVSSTFDAVETTRNFKVISKSFCMFYSQTI